MAAADELIEAIHRGELASVDDENAREVTAAIGDRRRAEASRVGDVLADAGIQFTVTGDPAAPAQTHEIELDVPDGRAAYAVADALAPHGFDVWEPLTGAARIAHRRLGGVLTLARSTDVTIVVRSRWVGARGLPRSLRPTRNDLASVDLPRALWPLYVPIRLGRIAIRRLARRESASANLGPFLATPDDLIPPLLEFAELSGDDVVVDVGCGDGRLSVAAAEVTGCRARGVEIDPALAERARARAAAAGLADRVDIATGDGRDVDLAGVTVVFLFLPVDAAARLVAEFRTQLAPGGRIIVHEQHRLVGPVAPTRSIPLLAGQGVTVAHRFDVP